MHIILDTLRHRVSPLHACISLLLVTFTAFAISLVSLVYRPKQRCFSPHTPSLFLLSRGNLMLSVFQDLRKYTLDFCELSDIILFIAGFDWLPSHSRGLHRENNKSCGQPTRHYFYTNLGLPCIWLLFFLVWCIPRLN